MCLIYVNFFEVNDVGEVILENYDYIFRVISECISCNFNVIGLLLSMICVKVKFFGVIEYLLDNCYVLFFNMNYG